MNCNCGSIASDEESSRGDQNKHESQQVDDISDHLQSMFSTPRWSGWLPLAAQLSKFTLHQKLTKTYNFLSNK